MSITPLEVEFDKGGRVVDQQQAQKILNALPDSTDLFVFAHAWNNDAADARDLYKRFFTAIDGVLASGTVPGLEGRSFGAVGVLWPSKKFDEDQNSGIAAASVAGGDNQVLLRSLEELKRDPERLGGKNRDVVREENLSRAQALVPLLEDDKEARREFVLQLRAVLSPGDAHLEDASVEFFTREPLQLFEAMDGQVVAPPPPSRGGAAAVGGGGGAAGLNDVLTGVRSAARRIANFATYYQMKERAGIVGAAGLSPFLRQIRRESPDVRLHLIGHSFGGRLITAAADSLDPGTRAVTLTLLQAAFSHNGLALNFEKQQDGFYRKLVAQWRASGPILITHTKNDRAVGVAYPLASRIARQRVSALGDQNDPYGGMGRNGARHTPEVNQQFKKLQEVGDGYDFAPGAVYNLNADAFIMGHGDVTKHQVAHALLHAVRAV